MTHNCTKEKKIYMFPCFVFVLKFILFGQFNVQQKFRIQLNKIAQ